MSDENNKNIFFSNEDTIVRRAWIESALASARLSLSADRASAMGLPDGSCTTDEASGDDNAQPSGPYLAWSADERRSGT